MLVNLHYNIYCCIYKRSSVLIMDLRLQHPSNTVVCGPSASGKSVFVKNLIEGSTKYFNTQFNDIIWCYAEWHPTDSTLKDKVTFQQGLGNLKREDFSEPRLIIVDDHMTGNLSPVVELFIRGTHHTNCSVIFITQNLFNQNKGARDISLNTHYLVLFKNPRDSSQLNYLSKQISPRNPRALQEAFQTSISKPHGYLLIDLRQSTPENCRFRTDILGEIGEGCETVYEPKYNDKAKSWQK